MSREQTVSRNPFSRDIPLGAFAAAAIIGWILVEVGLRWGLVPILAEPFGSARGADLVVSVIGFGLVTGLIAWWGQQLGITPLEWGYTVSFRSITAGLAGVVGYFVVYLGIVLLYATFIGVPQSPDAGAVLGGVGEQRWVLGAFLLINGILVPIVEELAWRGVIQTALMESFGTVIGSVVTAAAFVLKHVIVDQGEPWSRLVSLIVLALLLCGLRVRFGTASSTVTHIGVNSISTALIILASV